MLLQGSMSIVGVELSKKAAKAWAVCRPRLCCIMNSRLRINIVVIKWKVLSRIMRKFFCRLQLNEVSRQ